MAFTDPLVVSNDNITPNTTRTFNRLGSPAYGTTVYKIDAADTSGISRLKIAHQEVGKGVEKRDRHLVRVEADSVDAETNEVGTHAPCVGYLVLDVPRNNLASATIASAIGRLLVGFMRDQEAHAETLPPDYTTNFASLLEGLS